MTTDTPGIKFDKDKPQFSLVPPLAHLAVAQVLTFGAKKYAPDNWRKVENLERRYLDAAMRHINAYQTGEATDSESNIHHLAHAAVCLMFILEHHLQHVS